MSYQYEVRVQGDPKFYGNNVRFATKEEAERAGMAKVAAWTVTEEYRVVESDAPANYQWQGRLIPIEGEENGQA